MKLLHLDSSILGGNSASRKLSAAVVDQLIKATPGLDTIYRDLAAKPLSHLSGEHLAAAQGALPESPAMRKDIAASHAALEEFLAADIVVIGAPMYNFAIPTQLKA
ncbi:MAG: FMN-dependent NADH-azoreductase, partial [Rhizomicrobium sp.]